MKLDRVEDTYAAEDVRIVDGWMAVYSADETYGPHVSYYYEAQDEMPLILASCVLAQDVLYRLVHLEKVDGRPPSMPHPNYFHRWLSELDATDPLREQIDSAEEFVYHYYDAD